MADEKDPSYLEDDELLDQLLPDLDRSDVNPLAGVFVGKGASANTIRLYTTLTLDQYFQLPRDKVLGIKRYPSGRVVLWVPTDLRVQLVKSDTLPGDFLKGATQSALSRRSVGGSGLRRLFAAGPIGGTSWGGCRTDFPDPSGDPTCTLICTPPEPPPTGCSC